MNTEFDEIRPYDDTELPAAVEELIADPDFRDVASRAMPDIPFEELARMMRACRTKSEIQTRVCYKVVERIIERATLGISLDYSALEGDCKPAYTYVSNHRDIVLDSAFLSMLLVARGLDTVEIAIGDNLLIYPWIKRLVRLNKSFIVQRALSMRQKLESSARMSRYMHYTIQAKRQSIWIAQREGRAKDSDDRTQESVLKMMAMAGEGTPAQRLAELNIVPLAISYEFDPCDFLKAREFQLKRDNPDYRKTQADDLQNMLTGLVGYKGHVHLQVAPCLNAFLAATDDPALPRQEWFARVAREVDRGIHANYRLYPGNYVAFDLLQGGRAFATRYTATDRDRFCAYLEKQLSRIDLPGKDVPYLRHKLLEMYANPLKNWLEACGTEADGEGGAQ